MLNFIVPPVQWKDVLGRAKLLLLLLVSETKSNFIIKPIALNQVQIILCLFYMKREGNSSGVAFVWDICLEVVSYKGSTARNILYPFPLFKSLPNRI